MYPLSDSISDSHASNPPKLREDDARLQGVIDLLNSALSFYSSTGESLRKKLPVKQWEQLMALLDTEDHRIRAAVKDDVWFEYSHAEELFEIRMPKTAIQAGIRGLIVEEIGLWKMTLSETDNAKVSDLVKTLSTHMAGSLFLPLATGKKDMRVPDIGLYHRCKRTDTDQYRYPALVLETEFSKTKEELQERAKTYITGSNGQIRTVVAIHMYEMRRAEMKNEGRLRQTYRMNEMYDEKTVSLRKGWM
ncbi:hypothetical protein F5Y08DRAFT_355795 [Xylaria arbuscula]|nr:hypothetical protein F5Y08DRAFT_355795 [Xylaria arbuscula]